MAGRAARAARLSGGVPLVLASASPRRRELLARAGYAFEVQVDDVDETPRPGENAEALVERLAVHKARAVAALRPGAMVLGGDTVVVRDGAILGKPADREEAAAMLSSLAGREHEVLSGVAWVASDGGGVASGVARSVVAMEAHDDSRLQRYLDGEEWRGKAGGYAIQGDAAAFARLVSGELDTVIGLPVGLVRQLLERFPDERG